MQHKLFQHFFDLACTTGCTEPTLGHFIRAHTVLFNMRTLLYADLQAQAQAQAQALKTYYGNRINQ